MNLEQQFAQLNLSDSGEDSGIENREQITPPQPKRTQHKVQNPRTPEPTISLYLRKPSETTPPQSSEPCKTDPIKASTKIPPPPQELGNAATLLKEGDSFVSLTDSAETTILGDSSGSVTPVVNSPKGDSFEPELEPQPEVPVKKVPKCMDLSQAVNLGEVKKALDAAADSKVNKARFRRLSASSAASTTSDFSTASFHTCFEDVFEDLSSDEDEDYHDFEETDLEDYKDMLPWSHKYFITG